MAIAEHLHEQAAFKEQGRYFPGHRVRGCRERTRNVSEEAAGPDRRPRAVWKIRPCDYKCSVRKPLGYSHAGATC